MQALSSSRCVFSGARVQAAPMRSAFPAPGRTAMTVEAAAPKKKTSKSKTKIRAAAWKKEVNPYVTRALFLAKMALQKGDRDSTDKDMVIASETAAPATDAGSQ